MRWVGNRTDSRRAEEYDPHPHHMENDSTKAVPPCPKCGYRRGRIGVVPHEQYANIRIDLYRCVSCGERSEEAVLTDQQTTRSDTTDDAGRVQPRH